MNANHHNPELLKELGTAMLEFVMKLSQIRTPGEGMDDVLRQVATEKYREVVDKAFRQNVERSLCWHTLGVWTEVGKERIGYFARALECLRKEAVAEPPKTPRQRWCQVHMQAECLFEIGRVHFHEGAPAAARDFLTQALPLAREADALQGPAGVHDDRLEGKIAELLLNLPDEDQSAANAG